MNDRSIKTIAVIVAVVVILAALVVLWPSSDSGTEELSVTGSTTCLPVIDACADGYMDAHPNVDIQVTGGGSGHGVQAVGEGSADLGMASRGIKVSELETYPDLKQTEFAMDGLAVIVHGDMTVSNLTIEQIRGIYNGTYTNWDQLGGADQTIVPQAREDGSGTRDTFDSLVMDDDEYSSSVLLSSSNGAVKTAVTRTPGAIGYVGLGYVDDTVSALDITIIIPGGTQNVAPTSQNVLSGDYPLARALYLITDGTPASDSPAKSFIDYVLSPAGQTNVLDEGFIPIGPTGDHSGELTVTGSTTCLPVIDACADAFMDLYTATDIQISGGGSGHGVQAVGEGSADLGMASRGIKSSEMDAYPGLIQTEFAKDGIAVIVHGDMTVSNLTIDQIRGIYNGTYTNWNQLGGADQTIVPMAREDGSGTRDTFDSLVMDDSEYSFDVLLYNSNGAVKTAVTGTPGAIGYVGLGYVDDTVSALDIVVEDGNGTHTVAPTSENVLSGDYPLARALYLITDGTPASDSLAHAFIEYVLSPAGQQYVLEEGFVPLSATSTVADLVTVMDSQATA